MAQQVQKRAKDENLVKAEPVVKEERSLGDLFSELAGETSNLVRQEVALAQVEIADKATRAGKNVGYLVVGGAVAYAALLTLLAALVIGLADLFDISAWIPALIVGLIVGGVAFWMVTSALDALRKMNFTPQQTVETLKEDAEWLKDQVS
jgi:hypothetical protein